MRLPCRLPIPCLVLVLLAFGAETPRVPAEALPRQTHKAPKRASRATIEALEAEWRLAQLTGDVNAMERLLADDYVGITAAGQVNTKALQLERVRNRSAAFTQLDATDVKIKLAGTIAIVTSQSTLAGTVDGKPLNGVFRSTRIYQQQAGGTWKITSFEATRVAPANGGVRRPGDAPAPMPN